jgi:hypothetical protein
MEKRHVRTRIPLRPCCVDSRDPRRRCSFRHARRLGIRRPPRPCHAPHRNRGRHKLATDGCYVYPPNAPNEVNGLGPSQFDLYQQSNGAESINPVLLIFGVPNNPTNTIGNVTGAQLYDPYPGGSAQNLPIQAGSSAYGLNVPNSGLAGEMISGDVYTFLGGPGVDKSNSFKNWAAADFAVNGITAANFSICSPWI